MPDYTFRHLPGRLLDRLALQKTERVHFYGAPKNSNRDR